MKTQNNLFKVLPFLLLLISANECGAPRSVTMYGPYHIKDLYSFKIEPFSCEPIGVDQPTITKISFEGVGATVCVNEDGCEDDYLKLFESTFKIPSAPEDSVGPFGGARCGLDIEGEVIANGEEGTLVTIGQMNLPPNEDNGCVLYVDVSMLEFVSNPRLRIFHKNSGTLLGGHDSYAPETIEIEVPLTCMN